MEKSNLKMEYYADGKIKSVRDSDTGRYKSYHEKGWVECDGVLFLDFSRNQFIGSYKQYHDNG